MCRAILILCLLFLAGSAWGYRSIMVSQVPSGISEEPTRVSHDQSDDKSLKNENISGKTQTENGFNTAKEDKNNLNDKIHPFKELNIGDMIDSLFQPFYSDSFFKKKPKVKTVVSLTEVVGPKHHSINTFVSPFGMKESSFINDPFFEFPKMMSFVPKFSKIDYVWPMKQTRDKSINLTDVEFPSFLPCHRHHTSKRDMKHFENKNELFIKNVPTVMSLIEILDDKVTVPNEIDTLDQPKNKIRCLAKFLPYIEGAIGGVTFVMLIILIATWRVKKQGTIWTTVPFVDKSQYVEKV